MQSYLSLLLQSFLSNAVAKALVIVFANDIKAVKAAKINGVNHEKA
jgi:hypothetical protein